MPTASFQPTDPIAIAPLIFGMLVTTPTRETIQQISEESVPGSNDVIVDVIGKATTKIRGSARIDGFQSLKTFEGAVGSTGILVYSEEPSGIEVLFSQLTRTNVVGIPPNDIHICDIEFWITPTI